MAKKGKTTTAEKRRGGGRRRKPIDIEAPATAPPREIPDETDEMAGAEHGEQPFKGRKFSSLNAGEKKALRRWWRVERKRKASEGAVRTVEKTNGNGAQAPAGRRTLSWDDFRIVGDFTQTGKLMWRIHELAPNGSWMESAGAVSNPVEGVQYIVRKVYGGVLETSFAPTA